jgi:hypothetical protein
MTDLLTTRLPGRTVHLVGDAAYATEAWRGLPANVTLTSRLRSNAAVFAPKPGPTGQRGRPRKWGERLGSLTRIATDPATCWVEQTVRRYGKTDTLKLTTIDCLWAPLGPARVILVEDSSKPSGYQLALITTDLHASPAEIVERHADRWPIEVAFEEGKELFGVGHARNRTPKAVQRTVPFQFLVMTLTITRYTSSGHHPDIVANTAQKPPGTSPRPPPRSPTRKPSSAASSSPPNITHDKTEPPQHKK